MKINSFEFQSEEGEICRVSFSQIESEDHYRPYGIRGLLKNEAEEIKECVLAERRFATPEETEAIIYMLCAMKVTPCTLLDVL